MLRKLVLATAILATAARAEDLRAGSAVSGLPDSGVQAAGLLPQCSDAGGPCLVGKVVRQEFTASSEPATCVADENTLCLQGGRFAARVALIDDATGGIALAHAIGLSDQSGLFWFYSSGNIEMLIKVLNACTPQTGNHWWVFYSATTDRHFSVTVGDMWASVGKTYTNPLGRLAPPVGDTSAFATCP